VAVLLLAVLAVAVARDQPPTLFPYPGRFVMMVEPDGDSYLLDRWTGRVFVSNGEWYIEIPRIEGLLGRKAE
jgi:hypothetical protein